MISRLHQSLFLFESLFTAAGIFLALDVPGICACVLSFPHSVYVLLFLSLFGVCPPPSSCRAVREATRVGHGHRGPPAQVVRRRIACLVRGRSPSTPPLNRPTDLTRPADDAAVRRVFFNEATPAFSRDGMSNDARRERGVFFSRGRIATGLDTAHAELFQT